MSRHDHFRACVNENTALIAATGLPPSVMASEGACRAFLTSGLSRDGSVRLDQLTDRAFEALQHFVLYGFPFDMDTVLFEAFEARRTHPSRPEQPSRILFYSVTDAYGFLSNFLPAPIRLKGARWPSSEHYFQAQKFAGTPHEAAIRKAATPAIAARMGRDRRAPLRRDWESVKEGIMQDAVQAKFTQHPDLREALLATGDAMLVEHTEHDADWGDGGDGRGHNRLGKILVQIRQELRT